MIEYLKKEYDLTCVVPENPTAEMCEHFLIVRMPVVDDCTFSHQVSKVHGIKTMKNQNK